MCIDGVSYAEDVSAVLAKIDGKASEGLPAVSANLTRGEIKAPGAGSSCGDCERSQVLQYSNLFLF
jgi:hypothetical protein